MPPSHVLHPPARLAGLLHNHRPECSIVLATPLAHDLDPLHRSSHCGCHTGSLILDIHASQQNHQQLATQGGRGRTLTLLARNREENLNEAHHLLFESFNRGIPYFTTGVVWLIEGLEQTSIGCPTCTEILRKVRGVARSMALSQAFTSFSIAKPQTRDAEETRPEFVAPSGQALVEPDVHDSLQPHEEAATQVALHQPQYLTLRQS